MDVQASAKPARAASVLQKTTAPTAKAAAPPSIEFIMGEQAICIPEAAWNLAGFRRWATSDDFPDCGRISFIAGEIIVDMSPEELSTHSVVKVEVARVIANLNMRHDWGMFFGDGTLLSNTTAELSTEPDGTFVTYESIRAGRVRLVPRGEPDRYMEVEGTPDWVLEILSKYSVRKDTKRLMEKYHRAEIPEYWLIDGLGKKLKFTILLHHSTGYEPVPVRNGWQRSRVFARDFRLERKKNRVGFWQYTLHVRPE